MLHDFKRVDLFPELSADEMARLAEHGRELHLSPGNVLFNEGDPTYHFYVVLDGQIQITKRMDGEEQVLVVHQKGHFTGELSMITGAPATATARAIAPSRILEIDPDAFKRILAECSKGAAVIMSAMAGRTREIESQLRQREKLAALGKLSAGLAHELNNPAAAGRRAAQQLREAIASVQTRLLKLCEELFPDTQRQMIIDLQQEAIAHSVHAPRLDPLTQSDREDALTDWLDEHDIADGWQLAPILVAVGIDEAKLQPLADQFSPEALTEALNWLTETLTIAGLLNEIDQSTARISQLVKAIKSYSYMDQAPLQEIDIHEGLENTLTILNHKLKHGITVNREFAPNLPHVCAYGSELNQVWTNLIDNSIYALKAAQKKDQSFTPTITIRTACEHEFVKVQIIDNGAGIPPEIQSRIFEPFFTTKGVGEGSGLGLDIVRKIVMQRHHGSVQVRSEPGETCFQICIPLAPPKKGS